MAALLGRSSPISCPVSYLTFWLRFFLSHPADILASDPASFPLILCFQYLQIPNFLLNCIRSFCLEF
jgi:hypothetical protein